MYRQHFRPYVWGLAVLLCFPFWAHAQSSEVQLPDVNIGIVIDGPWQRNAEVIEHLQEEIRALTAQEFNVHFSADHTIIAQDRIEVAAGIDQLLEDEAVDLVITYGFIGSNSIIRHHPFNKPVIAPFISHLLPHRLDTTRSTSTIKNLNYVFSQNQLIDDLKLFAKIAAFDHISVVADYHMLRAFPQLEEEVVAATAKELGIEYDLISIPNNFDPQIIDALSEAQAVYLFPLVSLDETEFQSFADELLVQEIPSFSSFSKSDVNAGILAGSATQNFDLDRINRRVALNVQRILLGDAPESINTEIIQQHKLTINMATAKQLNIWPRWELLIEAELINNEAVDLAEDHIDLKQAVMRALEANLQLASKDRSVIARFHEINLERAKMRPYVELYHNARIIDDERANNVSIAEMVPEMQATAGARFRYTLYSDGDRMNRDIARHKHHMAAEEWQTLKLDIILATSVAYLDVLRAQAFENIERENYELTRSHYELAEYREKVGAAGPSEALRWEREIAMRKSNLLNAQAKRYIALINFNQLMHIPLETQLSLEDIQMKHDHFITADDRLFDITNHPRMFLDFRDFLVLEGMRLSPEIRKIDEAIEAQERVLLANKRSYYHPEIALEGAVDYNYFKKGLGSDFNEGPFAGFPPIDETDWVAALKVSFPLYTGGKKRAHKDKNEAELEELLYKRGQFEEEVGQRIRSSLRLFSASHANIALSNESSAAAHKNLEVVVDGYTKGTATILDLLDAQNAAIVSDQVRVNAEYNFLVDYMRVQRASGQFDFLMDNLERDEWFARLLEYVEYEHQG